MSRSTDPDTRDFDRLLDALVSEPWKVKAMLCDEPALVKATNISGETVIHWFIVENDIEKVRLLHDCGSPIDPYALTEACSLGHVTMCELLLCYGVVPDIRSCMTQLQRGGRTKKSSSKLKAVFRTYGYPLTEA